MRYLRIDDDDDEEEEAEEAGQKKKKKNKAKPVSATFVTLLGTFVQKKSRGIEKRM